MRASFEADIAKRTHFYKQPPADFDPLLAPAQALAEYGLPARPDKTREPEAFAFWSLLLAKPLSFIKPTFKLILPEQQSADASPQLGLLPRRTHVENSRNWSGLYLQSKPGQPFVRANGAWHVPEPHIPAVVPRGPDATIPHHDDYRSSTWVGLNGHRTYPHVTMPQTGTRQYVSMVGGRKVVDIAAWWQWWSRDAITPEVEITNMPVKAGDQMLVSLTVMSADEVLFVVKNQTTGLLAHFLVQAPPKSEPLGVTAEWVVERPTWPTSVWPHKLPKLDDVWFTHCHAMSSASPIGAQTFHNLDRARQIRMYEVFENPYRTALVSIPETTGPTSARVSYREAGPATTTS